MASVVTLSWPFLWVCRLCMQLMPCGYFINFTRMCSCDVILLYLCIINADNTIENYCFVGKIIRHTKKREAERIQTAAISRWYVEHPVMWRINNTFSNFYMVNFLCTTQNSCQLSNEIRKYKPCIEWIICKGRTAEQRYVTSIISHASSGVYVCPNTTFLFEYLLSVFERRLTS